MFNWKNVLSGMRVEKWAWKEDGDIDSFRKGELEKFIQTLLDHQKQTSIDVLTAQIPKEDDYHQWGLEQAIEIIKRI